MTPARRRTQLKDLLPRFFPAFVLSAIAGSTAANAQPPVESRFIFTNAPFKECHASTIVEVKPPTPSLSGEAASALAAAWFGGTREGHNDVAIWVSFLRGNSWSAPNQVADGIQPDGSRVPCWNPVLFQLKKGPLLLFYKAGPSPSKWWGMLMSSADAGKTWSVPRRLPDGILGPIKNKPVELQNGVLLCPSSTEHEGWRVHFERTTDLGQTWTATPAVNDGKEFGAIQPAILFHGPTKLQALSRTRQQTVSQVWSEDGGKTWGAMRATNLPNPNSGLDAVTLQDGRHLLVYNHTTKGRSPLNVAWSKDGADWMPVCELETEPGEYSYPAVIQDSRGLVQITYTWKRLRVKHVTLDPSRIENP